MDDRVYKVGILGAGFIADFHLDALQRIPGIRVMAVCDTDTGRAESLRRRWGVPEAHHSLDQMLAGGVVDVVHILVPPPYHFATATRCLEAGCDVFVEKPMVTSAADARRLREAVTASGRALGVNHNNTCHPAFLRLAGAVRDCRLGRLEHVTACLSVPLRQLNAGQHSHWMFQSPLNIVLEQGSHPLSQIVKLLGEVQEASTMVSGGVTLNSGAVFHDTWQVSVKCQRGTAQLYMSFGRENLDFWIHAIGQDGAAVADLRRNTFRLSEKTRFMEPIDNLVDTLRGAASLGKAGTGNFVNYVLSFFKLKPPADPFPRGMRNSIADFYADLRAGRPPREGVSAGLAVVEACEAVAEGGHGIVAGAAEIQQEVAPHA